MILWPMNHNSKYWALVSNLGFLKFQIFRFSILDICFSGKIFLKNMLVRYRGINNKGVLERPWTKWRVLRAISTTLKCQFTGKCWKVDFPTPYTTKSAENSPGSTVRPVRTSRKSPNTPNSILNFRKNRFLEKLKIHIWVDKTLIND